MKPDSTIFVDAPINQFRGMVMCHMQSEDIEALHLFAKKLGLKREWFQPKSSPHYDISLSKRKTALSLGAKEADRTKVVQIIRFHRYKHLYLGD